jgi:hypothetical protein
MEWMIQMGIQVVTIGTGSSYAITQCLDHWTDGQLLKANFASPNPSKNARTVNSRNWPFLALQRQVPRIKPITVSATVRNPPLISQ